MNEKQQKLLEELPSLGTWHHTIDLGYGIKTAQHMHSGYDPEERWNIIAPYIPEDLTGKSVLDLGANSGYLAMKMKKRGASRVVAVDFYEGAVRQIRFIAQWYGVDIEIIQEDVHAYCLTTEERFDYVIFLGLFYHLRYGTLVLDRLAEMTRSRLFFQTILIGPESPDFEPDENYTWEDINGKMQSENFPKLYFIEKKFNHDLSNWWFANEAAAVSLLRNAGLKITAQPGGIFVCEPDQPLGKKIYNKCVFPRHGKPGSQILPE
jgi:tRNA (mo5U34)-methyltransferase